MTGAALDYGVVTPARNEAENLARLGRSMCAQTVRPQTWVIVDHGSTDATAEIADELAAANDWIRVRPMASDDVPRRGGPIVRAFQTGLAEIRERPEVIVKLDADVSFEPEHFEQLLTEFANDGTLGLASSTCWEEQGGVWKEQMVARSHVRGAVRAYRRECLEQVLPLEERIGWDTLDELKAQANGWRTCSLSEIPFYHHRATGARDGARRAWEGQGDLAYYLGYRVSYLLLRTAFRARHDPYALAMIYGWLRAAVTREPRYDDAALRSLLRSQQRLSQLPLRAREMKRRQLP